MEKFLMLLQIHKKEIDTVSGATNSLKGIIEAINVALAKAK